MVLVTPPKRTEPYPDRDIDCEEAIEPRFFEYLANVDLTIFWETYLRNDLVSEAKAAGWGQEEVQLAIRRLSTAYELMLNDIDI
ncbi:hypothetical protein [Phyllobacterium myrsinacearum]|uniref:Uncharacterized protein n=1 Tax=Phyllobacterium myrsinacearum TaxID=28101 RepID=A0A839EVZ4_9HYPH|nr:hypothetical protein [Phyllobacterium myrsinacearum]MBA8881684.1 hypothetical protein [Phyllobacterium myrsinacearum]